MTRTARVSFFIVCIGSICWLGGINVRALIGFNLLETGTLDFRPNIHPYAERTVFGLIAQSSLVVMYAYICVWIAGIVFLRSGPFRLKEHGWLMMSAILFYLFTPVEVYTMVLDFRMWLLDVQGSNDLVEFRKLFIHRLAALAGVPIIALMCYYTIIVLAVFRPFVKRPEAAS